MSSCQGNGSQQMTKTENKILNIHLAQINGISPYFHLRSTWGFSKNTVQGPIYKHCYLIHMGLVHQAFYRCSKFQWVREAQGKYLSGESLGNVCFSQVSQLY